VRVHFLNLGGFMKSEYDLLRNFVPTEEELKASMKAARNTYVNRDYMPRIESLDNNHPNWRNPIKNRYEESSKITAYCFIAGVLTVILAVLVDLWGG